ncbi:hypothetical protein TTHERM_00237459 (macronuclear) [Tetrahymena thermophila SB210]|uniref:Uncharacterized protein n=1 Tax=Tetrahymena thermophila (strain SB210) TaxID=312017 RepID=X1W3P4_TETTS|nr:hypothetical protein TTHERM_00237459 [Tetrahymena thermophila SB210]EDK31353.1 hypothetical protein TTHERM_00237459 [Tetrahymena thermophila SB210]|eukprot:XP_001471026.1 hypothetical protein TTHERM_00237459 [Tetrahymena thermophila SB210]
MSRLDDQQLYWIMLHYCIRFIKYNWITQNLATKEYKIDKNSYEDIIIHQIQFQSMMTLIDLIKSFYQHLQYLTYLSLRENPICQFSLQKFHGQFLIEVASLMILLKRATQTNCDFQNNSSSSLLLILQILTQILYRLCA